MATYPENNDDEDDYLSMKILEPERPKYETSAQRRTRQKKEAESRSHNKSKADREVEEAKAREGALATEITDSSKGFKMLSKMGYKRGSPLGPVTSQGSIDARIEPIPIELKSDKAGIGLGSERKRKIRESLAYEEKRVKVDENNFRERVSKEKGDQRYEHLWRNSMKILECFEETARGNPQKALLETNRLNFLDAAFSSNGDWQPINDTTNFSCETANQTDVPCMINILYRSLARERFREDCERHMKPAPVSLSHQDLDSYGTGGSENNVGFDMGDCNFEDDTELDELEALEPRKRLEQVVEYLRSKYQYCFWCKHAYKDAEMDGCPGRYEDDHG